MPVRDRTAVKPGPGGRIPAGPTDGGIVAGEFNGVINLDVRDSIADWSPYELPRAPDGAPNVLVVLYDDTGLASWSPYGGRINMPTMD